MAVADAIGPGLSAAERDRASRIFRTTSRYEWMFWDMAYHRRGWPV
jgi:thiaminase (transcriptional activator TenA)